MQSNIYRDHRFDSMDEACDVLSRLSHRNVGGILLHYAERNHLDKPYEVIELSEPGTTHIGIGY